MSRNRSPEEALQLIDYLVSKGKRPNSFENAFPRIHHFKGNKGSLHAHRKYLESPEAEKTHSRQTNQNVVKRLELIKAFVDDFLDKNPGWKEINEFKYQTFAEKANLSVPLKKPR